MPEVVTGEAPAAPELRPIGPDDAKGLSELITRCYGDAYPKDSVYRPDEMAALIRSDAYAGVVAVDGGLVVGHIGYSWPEADATVAEAGTTVVDQEWRGRGLMKDLAQGLVELLVADGAVGFVHFPTTAHTVMQRASLETGGRETGILVAYLPPEARDPTISEPDDQRLALTVAYQPLLEASPQQIYLPKRYEDLILEMAGSLGLDRSVAEPFHPPRTDGRFDRARDTGIGLEHVTVERIGADLIGEVEALIEQIDSGSIHLDLPLNDAGIDDAVERLIPLGFAFCAWLPGWAGHDVLRLQRIAQPTRAELSPTFFSAEAEALMELIRSEISASS